MIFNIWMCDLHICVYTHIYICIHNTHMYINNTQVTDIIIVLKSSLSVTECLVI